MTDPTTLIFDPEEEEDEFFFHGNKQSHRDITKRVNKKLLMDFDDVFNDQSTNGDIFETCMKPLVTEVMNGFSCSGMEQFFMYRSVRSVYRVTTVVKLGPTYLNQCFTEEFREKK